MSEKKIRICEHCQKEITGGISEKEGGVAILPVGAGWGIGATIAIWSDGKPVTSSLSRIDLHEECVIPFLKFRDPTTTTPTKPIQKDIDFPYAKGSLRVKVVSMRQFLAEANDDDMVYINTDSNGLAIGLRLVRTSEGIETEGVESATVLRFTRSDKK